MANANHVELLLGGVEAWNRRRNPNGYQPTPIEGGWWGDPIRVYQVFPHWSYMADDVGNSPDLSECDLRAAFEQSGLIGPGRNMEIPLSQVNLSQANLRGANLFGANLTGANLWYADLRNANMENADLSGADVYGADLRNANLTMAKFHGARLDCANLQGADLVPASFGGAQLHGANLAGAYLADTGLREAQLWPDSVRVSQRGGEQPTLSDVADMVRLVESLESYYRERGEVVQFYFRGEGDFRWRLMPSLTRTAGGKESEGAMLVALIGKRPEEMSVVSSSLGQWVLAQHHGLKTRFLDITKNPLVGLFHACVDTEYLEVAGKLHVFAVGNDLIKSFDSDSVSVVANFAKLPLEDKNALLMGIEGFHDVGERAHASAAAMGRLYQRIRQEKPYFEDRIDPRVFLRVLVMEPQQFSQRIRAQASGFLISASHERFERSEVLRAKSDTPVYGHYELAIPREAKEGIVRQLALMDVSRETLFPGLDSSAEAVSRWYLGP